MAELQKLTKTEVVDRLAAVPKLQKFRNSTVVTTIRGIPIMIEDIALACAGSGLNFAVMGRPGTAKSLLTRDIAATWFAGAAVQFPCHFDMKPKDVFEKLNLTRTAGGKLTLSASTLTGVSDAVGVHCIIADDINRAPEVVQAPLQQIAEGYTEVRGVAYQIGDGYCTFLASANHEGSDKGAFKITPPMRQRLHLLLDTDYFSPTASDLLQHARESHEPKAYVKPASHPALTSDIAASIAVMEPSLEILLVRHFVELGLDYCERDNTSKRSQWRAMPGMCQGCQHLAKACGYILPLEPRLGDVIARLTIALQLVAEAKARKIGLTPSGFDWQDALQVFSLVAPSVGVYDATRIREQYRDNAYRAISEVTGQISEEFHTGIQSGSLLLAAGSLLSGSTDKAAVLSQIFTRRMGFIGDILRDPHGKFEDEQVFGVPREQLIESVRRVRVNGTPKRSARAAASLGATLFDEREEQFVTDLQTATDTTQVAYALIWLGEHGSAASLNEIASFIVRPDIPDQDLRNTARYQFEHLGRRLVTNNGDAKIVFKLLESPNLEIKKITLDLLLYRFEESPVIIATCIDLIKKQKLRPEDALTVINKLYGICDNAQKFVPNGEGHITDSVRAAYAGLNDISGTATVDGSIKVYASNMKSRLAVLAQCIGRTRAQASTQPLVLDLVSG